jgi:hypothetical protein
MWPSEEITSRLYDLANIGLIFGLIIGVISTVLIVWMGNKKETYLRQHLADTNERAAHAEERAAEATSRTEEERVKRLELEASIQPRRLTADQKAKLTSVLKPFSAIPITLDWVAGGGQESADLASDINDALMSAGIAIKSRNLLMDQYFKGIILMAGDSRLGQAEVIATFLIEVGLAKKPVGFQKITDPQELTIVVGSKP